MSLSSEKLLIFTRYPTAGSTKTRLIESLGGEGAADLQRRMSERTVAVARTLPADLEVRYFGGSREQVSSWLGDAIRIQDQGEGDLGVKMARAFAESFAEGYQRVIIIGADCPSLTAAILSEGFTELKDRQMVLGPAEDGGYYLLGLTRSCPALFEDQPWGTSGVLDNTLAVADKLGLEYRLLEKLHDIDRPEDLARMPIAENTGHRISIIIPTLNEEENLAATLKHLSSEPEIEIIVADGGSHDKTPMIAESFGVKVVHAPFGRGVQQNAGAAAATGDILLFLHADTLLPRHFASSLRSCLVEPGVVAGAFSLAIDLKGSALRLIEKGANFRSRFLQMPYGDQAIFLRKETFTKAGGFPEIGIMEDFALVKKLRRFGKIEILEQKATTSGRRWREKGILKTTLINQVMVIAYLLGAPPTSLASWYRMASRARS
ncbi:MAG: TIGR04283 family arsenosugar biosynthesis glycosyltransferase [Proteobacteria bacterium]|nr:TIGR04283 family arsenosugar biosynthesis glycosyltransferase [Pseudomonadota bacterium]MBU1739498.1 TIGR04283 family arsenosugar biosynthesis glycosyltransferase [Pseudomonadota bacterium]